MAATSRHLAAAAPPPPRPPSRPSTSSSLRLASAQLLAGPSKPSAPPKASELKEKQAVARSGVLRVNGGFLPEQGFAMRRSYFTAKVRGAALVAAGQARRRIGCASVERWQRQ